MKWFKNLKISLKLILTFILISAIAIMIGVVGIFNMNQISNADNKLYNSSTLGITYAGQANSAFQQVRLNFAKLVYGMDQEDLLVLRNNFDTLIEEVELNISLYKDTIDSTEEADIIDRIKPEWEKYKTTINETFDNIEKGQMAGGKKTTDQAMAVADIVNKAFSELLEYKVNSGSLLIEQNVETANKSTITMIVVMIAGVVVAILTGIVVAGSISKPLLEMLHLADKLALGDIDVLSTIDQKDEIGLLDKALARMVQSISYQAHVATKISEGDYTVDVVIKSEKDVLGKALSLIVEKNNQLISKIAASSEQVLISAKQISDSSFLLSEGSTEQASSVEELTASLEEISSQTRVNAENAAKANELSDLAKDQALQGNTQMKEMLESMEEINAASSNISKIIKVIDEIAFQTNILALNAAVEAARAGQHGKGFAVVAEEVKNLSARSANAAKETTDMIESSILKTEAGTKMAKNTADALSKIVNRIEEVATLVNDIAVASDEQALGIEQINQGIMQVSQVVQTNSATSEENASASEELSEQAEGLRNMIGQFKLKKSANNNKGMEELSPEILQMLEGMAQKKGAVESQFEQSANNIKPARNQIVLNDNEFGKY